MTDWIERPMMRVGSRARAARLIELAGRCSHDELHELLGWWTACDAASSGPEGDAILALFREAVYVSNPPRRFHAPTTVYRGNLGEDPRLGFSWTLSKAKARWFALYVYDSERARWLGLSRADREEPVPTVWRAIVENEAILGYFNNRREREVIVDPQRIDDVAVVLRPRPTRRT